MSDLIDLGSERAEEILQDALAEHQLHARSQALKPCGVCHWCGEGVQGSQNFCDKDCLGDWERDQARKRREGR